MDGKAAVRTAIYLPELYSAEAGVAERLKYLLAESKQPVTFDKDRCIAWVQRELNIKLAEKQATALKECLNRRVMIIAGGPGTGKTTTINSIIRVNERLGNRVLLAAPTGRAAKRLSETSCRHAETIHRLLQYSPAEGAFKRASDNPLNGDLIIVDEMSMVDIVLMHRLLEAVPKRASLLLVGDPYQLASVGPGNVLKSLIESGSIHTCRLDVIFRQFRGSMITLNAHRINSGKEPIYDAAPEYRNDFRFIQAKDDISLVRKIVALCKSELPAEFGVDPFSDIQVLSPMRRGAAGVVNLNNELRRCLNPSGDEFTLGEIRLRVGDKVMQTENNYTLEVFNGDMGRVKKINKEDQVVTVAFDGRDVRYDYAGLAELTQAFAVTVHKSQGSEYPIVILPVCLQHRRMLRRNLLYTGITRAKQLVILVGSKQAIRIAAANNADQNRQSRLAARLTSV